ncbi:hypothetical protein ACFL56_01815 [Candidatus Margulisiibacteriota bacterium]
MLLKIISYCDIHDTEQTLDQLAKRIKDRLFQLYKKSRKISEYCKELNVLLRYVLIDSKDLPEGFDVNTFGGALFFTHDLFETETKIFICRDIFPEKYIRYIAIHETIESLTGSHDRALYDEFRMAKKELSDKNFKYYCTFRYTLLVQQKGSVEAARDALLPSVVKIALDSE